jgi:teichuronic acid biosynthesis glycosyltransferase TuaC
VVTSPPLRTLLFSTLYPSSVRPGHGIFVETRLRELLKSGEVETRVVAPVPWFPSTHPRHGDKARMAATPRHELHNGIAVWHPRYLVIPKVGMTLAPLLLALGALGTVRQLISDGFDPDVIDAHYYYPDGVAAALLGQWLGKPVTVTARGTDINLIPGFRWPRQLLRWAAGRVAASIGVSDALVQRMRALAFDPARLHVMRNGVDTERFRPLPPAQARARLGLDADGPVLLTVGNLHEYKGQRLALEAWALMRQRHPLARLLIVGEGPDRGWLQARAQELGAGDAVMLAGTVSNTELYAWYSAADLLVLASSREGWPNVLLEAMACGTPVVATDVGGVREIVCNPEAGRVIGERSADALVDAINGLLAQPPERRAVRGHALQYGWERTTHAQLALFRQVAARG